MPTIERDSITQIQWTTEVRTDRTARFETRGNVEKAHDARAALEFYFHNIPVKHDTLTFFNWVGPAVIRHSRAIFQRLLVDLSHTRIIVALQPFQTLRHSRNILLTAATLTHRRRILPAIIPLYTEDIQRPVSDVRKLP